MRMRYPRHLNIGAADSPVGSCELVKRCQVFQPGAQRRGVKGNNFSGAESLWWRRITVGGAEWLREAPKSSNKVASTFFNTVHLLPKSDANMGRTFACDLRFEQGFRFETGGTKLASCTGRHLTSLRLCSQQWWK